MITIETKRVIKLQKQLAAIEGEIVAHHGGGGCAECQDSVYSVTAPTCAIVSELVRDARDVQKRLEVYREVTR